MSLKTIFLPQAGQNKDATFSLQSKQMPRNDLVFCFGIQTLK